LVKSKIGTRVGDGTNCSVAEEAATNVSGWVGEKQEGERVMEAREVPGLR
jgi:hypothetical protein